jgi:hypothetical protein
MTWCNPTNIFDELPSRHEANLSRWSYLVVINKFLNMGRESQKHITTREYRMLVPKSNFLVPVFTLFLQELDIRSSILSNTNCTLALKNTCTFRTCILYTIGIVPAAPAPIDHVFHPRHTHNRTKIIIPFTANGVRSSSFIWYNFLGNSLCNWVSTNNLACTYKKVLRGKIQQ